MTTGYNIPQITVQKEDELWGLPRELLLEKYRWIKHVYCPGSRKHVISYHLIHDFPKDHVEMKCSEPDCVMNAPIEFLKKLSESK